MRHLGPVTGATLLMAVTLLARPAHGAIRCGTELVAEGDSVAKLLEHCGEPAIGEPAMAVGTAEWTYNFGPNEFMVRVLVRDGMVERIEELGYGFVEPLFEDEALPEDE